MRRADRDHDEWLLRLGERHGRTLWRYVARFERDRGAVEEIVNDVLRLASQEMSALRGSSDQSVERWLLRTAFNLTANSARQSMNRRRLIDRLASEPIVESAPNDEDWWEAQERADAAAERAERVGATLAQLRDDYRLVLVMNAHGSSAAEVAEVLGVSENAARKRLMRARAAFRAAYDDSPECRPADEESRRG